MVLLSAHPRQHVFRRIYADPDRRSHGRLLAVIRLLEARMSTAALCETARAHIASEADPELSRVVAARGPGDLGPHVLDFVHAYLLHAWG